MGEIEYQPGSLVRSVPVLSNRLRRPCGQDQDAQRQGVNGSVLAEVEQVPESVMCGLELGEQITGRTVGQPGVGASSATSATARDASPNAMQVSSPSRVMLAMSISS